MIIVEVFKHYASVGAMRSTGELEFMEVCIVWNQSRTTLSAAMANLEVYLWCISSGIERFYIDREALTTNLSPVIPVGKRKQLSKQCSPHD